MKKTIKVKNVTEKGSITPALLIITTAFVIIIYGLLFVLTLQLDFSHRQTASEKALNIAEAGINYYRWHLAHDPDDFQDGTGLPGPYIHDYHDPQGNVVGQYSLEIDPPEDGSSIVTIRSTGWTNEYPRIKRIIRARYGKLSFSQYSFLSNASAWYGRGSVVNGRVHSNNGIRMDGINTSVVSSAQEQYMCGTETGCSPPTRRPGVWGEGGDQGLWQFPVPQVDFDTISFDLANMKDFSQSDGLYLEPSRNQGYQLIFSEDGTVTVYEVISTGSVRGYSVPGQGLGAAGQGGCRNLYQVVENRVLNGVYSLSENRIIFVEDNAWVEGTVRGRVTIAVAKFPITSSNANIWITNNITYSSYDGRNILGLIAQNDIYFARDLPEYFNVDAVMMAQKGKIIRHGYLDWCGGGDHSVRQKLTVNGSIMSYFKSYWNFGTGPESGFIEREINYDDQALYNPPPYFPTTGGYEFISWTEEYR